MALSNTKATGLTTKVFLDTDLVAGAITVKTSSTTLYGIQWTNASSSANVYVKFYNSASTVTVGTTAPDFTLQLDNAESEVMLNVTTAGVTFSNGLQMARVSDGGGTAGTTAPAGSDNVSVRLIYS